MPDEKLKPCPCGLNGGYITKWVNRSLDRKSFGNVAQVRCNCGFSGPERYGDNCVEEAIKAWNTRPAELTEEEIREKMAGGFNYFIYRVLGDNQHIKIALSCVEYSIQAILEAQRKKRRG